MKKLLIALAASVALTASAYAGLWDSVATNDWEERTPVANYKLSVYGFDARVYEYRLKADPNVLCVATFSGGDTNGFQQNCVHSPNSAPAE